MKLDLLTDGKLIRFGCFFLSVVDWDMAIVWQKPTTRPYGLGNTVTRSHTFHGLTRTTDQHREQERSPRQRRITVGEASLHNVVLFKDLVILHADTVLSDTVSPLCCYYLSRVLPQWSNSKNKYNSYFLNAFLAASYMPSSKDQNGNFPEKVL